jgi:hypothetical protein
MSIRQQGSQASGAHSGPSSPWSLGLMFTLLGCSGQPHYAYAEGDACRTLGAFCVDANTAMYCTDGRWELRDCAIFCETVADGVGSSGCEGTERVGECVCEPPADGCRAGDSVCIDDDELLYCTHEWLWSNYSCMDICAMHPTHSASIGCMADEDELGTCYCTTEGTTCFDQSPVCVDQSAVLVCEDGIWVHVRCEDVCGTAQASCEPDLEGGAACRC